MRFLIYRTSGWIAIEDLEQLYKDSIKYMINDKKKIDNHLVNFIIPISKGECKEKIIDISSL